MKALEIIVVIVAAVLLLTWAARRLGISEPLLLVAGGCLVGLTPPFDSVIFPSELVLLLFLPALLYWEALTTSLREIRSNLRSITLQATGLVLLSTAAVAAVAHAMGFGWPIGFVLGAVLAPTDAVAVAAVADGMPRRSLTLVRAESLVNDGTALVLFSMAVGVATGQHPFSWPGIALRFAGSYAGGVAIGAVTAFVVVLLRRRMREPLMQSTLSVLSPFAAYLPAELAHVSGVLAVVTCGLISSQVGPRVIRPASRLQAVSFWEVTTFLLNGALFVMVGMQLPAAVRGLSSISLLRALAIAAVVSVVVIGGRILWFYTVPYLTRLLDRRSPQQRRIGARHRLPLAWAGMRGAVSLAAALAVPAVMADGRPLADRDATVFITVIVILVTLVALGPTLPAVVRWARLPADTAEAEEEEMAIRHLARTALDALPAHADRLEVPGAEAEEIAAELRVHADFATGEDAMAGKEKLETTALLYALLGVKREALVRLRDEGHIDDIVLRRVQELLDVEEVRLRVHPGHGRVTADGGP